MYVCVLVKRGVCVRVCEIVSFNTQRSVQESGVTIHDEEAHITRFGVLAN